MSGIYWGKAQSQGFHVCEKNKNTFTQKRRLGAHVEPTQLLLPALLQLGKKRESGLLSAPLELSLTALGKGIRGLCHLLTLSHHFIIQDYRSIYWHLNRVRLMFFWKMPCNLLIFSNYYQNQLSIKNRK